MPELKLYRHNRTISVFFSSSIEELLDDPEGIKGSILVDPSFTHIASLGSWKTSPFELKLDVDSFKQIFLSEDSLEGVTIKKASRSTLYFELRGVAIKQLAKAISKENISQVSQEILQQEQIAYESHNKSQFQFNYKFPLSFVSQKVQISLNLKQHNTTTQNNNNKNRLTPSHEIYGRIKHDQSMDKDLFVIGYLDRFTGIKESDFNTFVTIENEKFYNTSVPFHRIRYFKHKGIIVWDRDSRVNNISSLNN